jgi:hypothetical protein
MMRTSTPDERTIDIEKDQSRSRQGIGEV